MMVSAWLEANGFARFIELFEENEIDEDVLAELDENDLAGLGISLGARKKLLKAIRSASFPADASHSSKSLSPGIAKQPPQSAAERRQLTVMFVDLVGSTELSGRLDPEDMREVITGFQNLVAGIVTRFEGQVAKYMGDGVLCYFGWPKAHEDDAERSVRAGLSIVNDLKKLTAPDGQSLAVRIGVATGLVVVGDLVGEGASQEEAVVGDTPNLAARMQTLADAGQVVVAEGTRTLLASLFHVVDLGRHDLKGVDGLTPAFAVTGERDSESRFEAHASGSLSAMIGREHELALMGERWKQTMAGEGQLVMLVGEAGIGKSRLTRAMIDLVTGTDHVRINFQCSPYHMDSSLYPASKQLLVAAGIKETDSNDEKLDKLEAVMAGKNAQLLAAMLGFGTEQRYGPLSMSPPQQRLRTFQALAAEIVLRAKDRPVLLILEDAHWIDASTLEFLELCLDQIANEKVLILVTARPTFEHSFGGHYIVTKLALNRLSRDHVASVIAKIAGGRSLPDELLDEIAAKTDGVPLFIEELTKTVLESGALKKTATTYELKGPLNKLTIPTTLHDSLMARLDRLQPVKEVAQMAACIGREFSYSLLESISPLMPDVLQQALDQLISAELIFRRGVVSAATYTFKHALVRDAAYESLLKSRRQAIHASLVDALENTGAAAPELIAHHATRAKLTETAIEYWAKAGTAATELPAYDEAISHFNHAIELIQGMDEPHDWGERELELLVQVALAFLAGHGYSSQLATETFEQAARKIAATENAELRMAIYYGMWIGPYIRSNISTCLRLGKQIADEVDLQPEAIPRIIAHRMYAASLIAVGRSVEAEQELEISYRLYEGNRSPDFSQKFAQEPGVQIKCYQMLSRWMSGYVDQAVTTAAEAMATARELSHANTLCYAGLHQSVLAIWCRDNDLLKQVNDEVAKTAEEYGMLLWVIFCKVLASVQKLRAGDDDAFDELRDAIAEYEATDGHLWVPLFRIAEIERLVVLGRYGEARDILDIIWRRMEDTQELWVCSELQRLRGEIDQAEGDEANALVWFEKAIETAREQKARVLELRASVSLGSLLADQGQTDAARNIVEPAYQWFQEGHETPDLKGARAFLDRLG